MTRATQSLVILIAVLAMLPSQATAWSSSASLTQASIRSLATVAEEYRIEKGNFPDPKSFRDVVQSGKYSSFANRKNPLLDYWGYEIVYRFPGRHGEFDLYSVGKDGSDNDGGGDDVSLWNGVNEGYYYKLYWPRGHYTLIASCAFGLVTLIAKTFFYPSRAAVLLAGLCVSFGIILGCYWLLHPGVVPSRNSPLSIAIAVAGIFFVVFLAKLLASICKSRNELG